MQLKQTTAPILDPISLTRVKDFLRLDAEETDEDVTLNGLIQAAIRTCERHLQRSLITQTWTLYTDFFSAKIHLPRNPVQLVDSVTSYNSDGSVTITDAADYFLVDADQESYITASAGNTWPTVSLRPRNGVEVVYIAGYGDEPEDVPFDIRQGLLAMVAYLYEHRDEPGEGIPNHIKLLWSPYMVMAI